MTPTHTHREGEKGDYSEMEIHSILVSLSTRWRVYARPTLATNENTIQHTPSNISSLERVKRGERERLGEREEERGWRGRSKAWNYALCHITLTVSS